jgi:hypothetical protein
MTERSLLFNASPLHDLLVSQGYTDLRSVGASLCGLSRFVYTTGLVAGLTAEGYERRYCYEHETDARAALLTLDGCGHPSGPWIKCKGAGIDLLNPGLRA